VRQSPFIEAASLALVVLAAGCTATRPVAQTPTPETIDDYLRAHPHSAMRVTDSTGGARWVYDATFDGDTLRGLRTSTMPRHLVAIPADRIRSVAAPKFSASRTLGLIGAILAVGAVLVLTTPGPTY
jgi:hypothetical protein